MEQKDNESLLSENEEEALSAVMKDVEWSVDHENILVEWADKAMCYRWLHGKANSSYSKKNTWYTIPVIVISTLTGTANFAQDRVPEDYQGYFVMTVGAFNILAGIITTIQQFLKITQLNEAHRVSSIAWDKFYRNIKTELAKHPNERLPVIQFLKMCKEEFDRLMETSPVIPEDIIELFNVQFGDKKVNHKKQIEHGIADPSKKSDKINAEDMKIFKPEICDSLVSTNASRNPWYTDEMQTKQKSKQFREGLQKTADAKRVHAFNVDTVRSFKINFYNLNNRYPLDNEIIDNLGEQISPETIKSILMELDKNTVVDKIPAASAPSIRLNSADLSITGEENV
jgi:hypothetical protein